MNDLTPEQYQVLEGLSEDQFQRWRAAGSPSFLLEMSPALAQLYASTTPLPGRPGWRRLDIREFYSDFWLTPEHHALDLSR